MKIEICLSPSFLHFQGLAKHPAGHYARAGSQRKIHTMQLYSQADSKNNQQSKLIVTENKRMVARWERRGGLGGKGEGETVTRGQVCQRQMAPGLSSDRTVSGINAARLQHN